jgi:hypothetical protein
MEYKSFSDILVEEFSFLTLAVGRSAGQLHALAAFSPLEEPNTN